MSALRSVYIEPMGRGDSPLTNRLVFLVGCRRSGTNWLQRVLNAHPRVVGMPSETYLFSGALSEVAKRFQHMNPGSPKTGLVFMPRDRMLDAMRDFSDSVFMENLKRLDPDARYLVERTPWHVYDLELIGDLYPDARVIHIIRDGRDVARSLVSQAWGPSGMEEAAEEWRSSVAAGVRGGEALGARYLEVRYEALLESTELNVRRIYEWLDLETTPDVMARALTEARGEFNVDPNAPVVASGKWRRQLSPSAVAAIERVAGEQLAELGYEIAGAPSMLRSRPSIRRPHLPHRFGRRGSRRAKKGGLEDGASGYLAFDEFMTRLGAGRIEVAVEMLSDQAHVRVATNGAGREARGALAKQLLREHLTSLPAAEVSFGSLHPGFHTSSATVTYELPDGRRFVRTLTASITDGTLHSVSVVDFELGAAHTTLVAGA